MDIAFICRGRGRGHAVRDLTIAAELRALAPDLIMCFVSYDSGYLTLAESGETTYDLALPERSSFSSIVVEVASVLDKIQPTIVIVQEEPAALVAAKVCGVTSIFTTSWFPKSYREKYEALQYAEHVVFMEDANQFPVPASVIGKTTFVGPVIRKLNADIEQAFAVRKRFGLANDDLLITVLPGSAPESREPIWDLVVEAFVMLPHRQKRLIWVAGKDYPDLYDRAGIYSHVTLMEYTSEIELLILASEVLITKGTYNITQEIMMLGKKSISLSHRFNSIDDYFAANCSTNIPLLVENINSRSLSARMQLAIDKKSSERQTQHATKVPGNKRAAETILSIYKSVNSSK